jgi:hypothetical protein
MKELRPRTRPRGVTPVSAYGLAHLPDPVLLRALAALVAQDRATTAALLAHLAEVDARRLYLPAAYPSMFAYCVHELHFSEDAAYKRIQAARVARQFPAIFPALADGRLHLSAVGLLAPYLAVENADDLLGAAAGQTKAEIEALLAERFPRSETLGLVEALPGSPPPAEEQLAPGQVDARGPECPGACQLAPGQVGTPSKLAPVAPERFLLQLTIGRSTQDKLRYAQNLLGHALPSGDLAQVLDRALDALIEKLERRKFAAARRPRPSQRESTHPRHIPAQVKRAVWERDGGQCTFVSEAGHRCPARKRLEIDHVQEVARGGRASVAGIRLRCRGHNQYAAECTFGAEFMRHEREEARRAAEARRRQEAEARAEEEAQRKAAAARARAAAEEVITPLRLLGFRADEARAAAAWCQRLPEAPLEERVRAALSFLSRPSLRRAARIQPMPT